MIIKYTASLWILLALLDCLHAEPLSVQYRMAFEFAFFQHEEYYDYQAAQSWAKEYLEKKAELGSKKTLLQHYREAFSLAVSTIGLEQKEARQWAGELLLSRYRNVGDKNIAAELEELLNEVQFPDFKANDWCLQFLHADTPLYSSAGIFFRYREIYEFLRRRPEFSYSLEEAKQAALLFIERRYRFSANSTLFQQYAQMYQFASGQLQLSFEESRNFAIDFVTKKGTLPKFLPLEEQYRQAYLFARAGREHGLSLPYQKAKNWAITCLENKGYSASDKPLLGQYRQAYTFAYNGDFLAILLPLPQKNTPRNLFLHDKAADWAKTFIANRGYLAREPRQAYLESLNFAYSSEGMRMSLEEARQWASKFIERPLAE